MKVYRIKFRFSRLNDSKFILKCQEISGAMVDSIYFKDPTPATPEVVDAIGAFSDAVTAAASGDRFKVAEKNRLRKVLEDMMLQWGGYVTMVAAGDKTKLLASAYDVVSDGESQDITAPQSVKILSGPNSGDVIIKISGVKGKKMYGYEYTLDPLSENSVWVQAHNTKVKHLFEGLQPGKKYWFRIAVIGTGGVKVYSDVVSSFVK